MASKIELEIANLSEQLHSLKLSLESEREPVEMIRRLRGELEQAQIELEKAESEDNLELQARLHYGTIPDLERRIQEIEARLKNLKNARMLKDEVDAEDIEEIVSRWRHIPISMLMKDEEQKKSDRGQLAPMFLSKESIEIFFCYTREDELLLNELKAHLEALRRQGMVEIWYDRNISAGAEWSEEIDKHLNRAQIILLLINPDFNASDYWYD